VHAGPELLRNFPPLLLIVGGASRGRRSHFHAPPVYFIIDDPYKIDRIA
jgi:hypothetical protein